MSVLYQVEDVRFHYYLGQQKVEALRGVSFQITEGEIVCLSGPSGSGKSTLLNLLGLIEPVQVGKVQFYGSDFRTLDEHQKNEIRKFQLGFIFQNFHLFPVLTAEENVEYFLSRQGIPSRERLARVKEALGSVGLWEHRKKKPLEMSGGQRQRVAVARAVAKRPKVIIADEPTASLDQNTGAEIMSLFAKASRELGTTFVVSSHDPMVLAYCQKTLKLRDGLLAALHPYSASSLVPQVGG